jgi:hypothetical protein
MGRKKCAQAKKNLATPECGGNRARCAVKNPTGTTPRISLCNAALQPPKMLANQLRNPPIQRRIIYSVSVMTATPASIIRPNERIRG